MENRPVTYEVRDVTRNVHQWSKRSWSSGGLGVTIVSRSVSWSLITRALKALSIAIGSSSRLIKTGYNKFPNLNTALSSAPTRAAQYLRSQTEQLRNNSPSGVAIQFKLIECGLMPAQICNWHRFSVFAVVAFQSKTGASIVSPNNSPPGVTSQGHMREKIRNPTTKKARKINTKITSKGKSIVKCLQREKQY